MKKIILIVLSIIFTSNITYAKEDCKKYNGLFEVRKYNECVASNSPVSKSKLNEKKSPGKVMNIIKKGISKLNTDSTLIDQIKGKK